MNVSIRSVVIFSWVAVLGGNLRTIVAAAVAPGSDARSNLVSRPLAAQVPGAARAALFSRVPSAQTGIDAVNRFDDPQMWGARYQEFAFGSVGTGLAIGDYDGDGRPDIFVVSKTGPDHLYRNLGDFRFADVTAVAGVAGPTDAWKQGAVFVDVNNDGRLDLYVCRNNAPNLLYLNRGDGTFAENAHAAGLDVTDGSVCGSFGDYDGDGWLDLYLATNLRSYRNSPAGESDRLFRNRGDGSFAEVTQTAGCVFAAETHAAWWWDFDEDGRPDVYATNDYELPDQLWRNQGDGTFRDVVTSTVPCMTVFAMGADLGDVDNDGRLDLLVADMLPTTRVRDQRSLADARGRSVEPSDRTKPALVMRNTLFLNRGAGRFLEGACLAGLAATDWTWSVLLEDFDDDGWVDLHVTNGMIREMMDVDLRARLESAPLSEVPRLVRAAPVLREQNLAFRNLGDLKFENVSARWGLDDSGVSFGAAVGDLDGDGDLDLVYANFEAPPTVCRNEASGGHRVVFALHGTKSNSFGVGAIVRVDTAVGRQTRRISVGRGYASSSEPIAHFGLGADERIRRVAIEWPSGITQTFTDLPADRRYEITESALAEAGDSDSAAATPASAAAQFVEVGEPTGLGIMTPDETVNELAEQPLLTIRHNALGPGVAVADLNGDGLDDVLVGGTTKHPAQLLLASADGTFRPGQGALPEELTTVADASPLLIDVDGDGRVDVLLAKGGVARPDGDAVYQPQLWLNRGAAGFAPAPDGALPALRHSVGPVCAGDFDHDGRLDIFLGGRIVPGRFPETPRSALLRHRGGILVDVTDEIAPGLAEAGMVSAAISSDVDGDGWLDLLVAREWGGVQCWRSVANHPAAGHEPAATGAAAVGRHFEDASASLGFDRAGTGWWNSLAAGDFNGDGRPDYVAGNLGLNTRYEASPERPALLLSGIWDESGRTQLVEVEYDGDRLVPGRSRFVFGRAMPGLLRKFPTAKAYATASLADVFAPERIAAARRYSATEFRSGVFLSQPDGTYRFLPLPRVAQIAPIYGVVVADFDGDGHDDIYAVQNSYAPIAEVGRFSGGLSQLLRGDGHGQFIPVPPANSGLVVPGDAKALVLLDLDRDGWPEFMVTRNNDRALVFGNTGVPGRLPLSIALRGPPGNATGIGARLVVEFADGSTAMREIHAGAGYLSQSAAVAFFTFPRSNPPRMIHVRTPTGEKHDFAAPPRGGNVRITLP